MIRRQAELVTEFWNAVLDNADFDQALVRIVHRDYHLFDATPSPYLRFQGRILDLTDFIDGIGPDNDRVFVTVRPLLDNSPIIE